MMKTCDDMQKKKKRATCVTTDDLIIFDPLLIISSILLFCFHFAREMEQANDSHVAGQSLFKKRLAFFQLWPSPVQNHDKLIFVWLVKICFRLIVLMSKSKSGDYRDLKSNFRDFSLYNFVLCRVTLRTAQQLNSFLSF